MTEHIQSHIEHHLGKLTLNRPQALNALSLEMVRALMQTLLQWRDDPSVAAVLIQSSSPKAFCAGGDIRFFHQVGTRPPVGGSALLEDFFSEEYALNHLIHYYPKPYIALMDGVVMGGGMGITQSGAQCRMRIVTERTRMAMPETIIGLFPDVGGSYFLSRSPGSIGTYLALTCVTIGAADALYAGLADVYVPSQQLPALATLLQSVDPDTVRQTIFEFAAPFLADMAPGRLASQRQLIDRHFSLSTMADIMRSLIQDADPFALETITELNKSSPLLQSVTVEQLRRGRDMNVADCLRMERSMVRHCFAHGESLEGIRARVIDKDNAPLWNPPALEQVTADMVDAFFVPTWPDHAHPLRDLA